MKASSALVVAITWIVLAVAFLTVRQPAAMVGCLVMSKLYWNDL